MIIDILEWRITYTELMHWIATNGAVMHAITGLGGMFNGRGAPSTTYEFRNEEDYIAFKLAFQKEIKHSIK
jgi:hypothetical protein